MAWVPVFDPKEPYVLDDQTGERVVTCHKYASMHEPPLHAWDRTCLVALAPELFRKLADMVEHAKHHFPEALNKDIEEANKLIKQHGAFYERRERER